MLNLTSNRKWQPPKIAIASTGYISGKNSHQRNTIKR